MILENYQYCRLLKESSLRKPVEARDGVIGLQRHVQFLLSVALSTTFLIQ